MISIYDTSLRDGLQGEKTSLNLSAKLLAIKEIDKLGIHYIEGGFPLASQNEMKFFAEAQKTDLKHSKVVAFGSTKKPKVKPEQDVHMQALIQANTEVITIVGKTWTKHVESVLQTTLDENLKMIRESCLWLKNQGKEVIYDAEHFFDGFKEDPDYALETLAAALDGGADIVVLCDTNGGTLYSELDRILGRVNRIEGMRFGVHFHNDTDCGVVNSLMSLDYGAQQIQGTINGWGERCGNANLATIIANLFFKTDHKIFTDQQVAHLTHVSRYLDELANLISNSKQPYVGRSAFAHKAGQHADVIAKYPQIMEHIDSSKIGNSRRILLSELAGKASIAFKISKFGRFDKTSPEVKILTNILKEKEQQGFEFEAAEASFELIARKQLGMYRPIIDEMEYRVDIRSDGLNQKPYIWAFVRIKIEGREFIGDAKSIGPVGALDSALRKAMSGHYDFVHQIHLEDYKVRVINENDSTESKVRVHIESKGGPMFQGKSWGTTGVSPNIIDASWQALIDSFDYAYNELKEVQAD